MNKISHAEVGQMMKMSADSLRALSEENQELKSKVAHYEKKDHAEKIANLMEDKSIESELSYSEKVAALMKRDNLSVVEEAVGLTASQAKLASVYDETRVPVDGSSEDEGSSAALTFASNLAGS